MAQLLQIRRYVLSQKPSRIIRYIRIRSRAPRGWGSSSWPLSSSMAVSLTYRPALAPAEIRPAITAARVLAPRGDGQARASPQKYGYRGKWVIRRGTVTTREGVAVTRKSVCEYLGRSGRDIRWARGRSASGCW